jgi:hypothetical protein
MNAQEGARIYHVTGGDFALNLRGKRSVFTDGEIGKTGMELERSGIVHTGPGTFLEIQLLSFGTVVKLSENSSLIYNGIDETGKFEDLGLLYGKIRVLTGNGTASGQVKTIVVRSGGISTKINEGDFAFDYIFQPGGQNSVPRPQFFFNTLRGSAEVFPYGMRGNSALSESVHALTANKGECLFLDVSSVHTYAEKRPISRDILGYWDYHNFSGSPPRPMPDTRIAAEEILKTGPEIVEIVREVEIFRPDPTKPLSEQPTVISNRGKNICLALGLFMTASSIAAQIVTDPQFDFMSDHDLAYNIQKVSYGTLGMGLIVTLGGIFFNPSRQ